MEVVVRTCSIACVSVHTRKQHALVVVEVVEVVVAVVVRTLC